VAKKGGEFQGEQRKSASAMRFTYVTGLLKQPLAHLRKRRGEKGEKGRTDRIGKELREGGKGNKEKDHWERRRSAAKREAITLRSHQTIRTLPSSSRSNGGEPKEMCQKE